MPQQTIASDIRKSHLSCSQNFSQDLKNLRKENPTNLIFDYLNTNCIRNKFTNLQKLIKDNVHVVIIAETKIDTSFKKAQFSPDNYHQLFRLYINNKYGGILPYVKSSIPSRKLKCDVLSNSIQAIKCELNLRKEKSLVISIYRPPSEDSEFFLNSLTITLDHFAKTYDNYLIMGDFKLKTVKV